jgi:hypothetical protein
MPNVFEKGFRTMSKLVRFTSGRRPRVVFAIGTALLCVCTVGLSAHRVIGRQYPTLATAFIQPPPAPNNDLPIPLWNTGLSVVCLRVANTSLVDTRITGLGFDLPGNRGGGFALISPIGRGITLQENVGPIPGFPGAVLDFALIMGSDFATTLGPNPQPTVFCVSGPFDPTLPIETMLNGVFVGFEGGGASGSIADIGVWERR